MVDDRRIWVIAEAMPSVVLLMTTIHEITKIDMWFIDKIAILVEMEGRLRSEALTVGSATKKQNVSSSRIKLLRD